jgi:hypothetical protein
MESDVRLLFQLTGLSRHPYHEILVEAARDAAAARWPLLAAVDRLLGATPPAPAESDPQRERGTR